MDKTIKKFIDDFKGVDVKKQFAYLDALNDLLIYTRKEFKPKTTSDSVLIGKALKDSDLLEFEQYKDDKEKLKEEFTIFINFLKNILQSFESIIGDRGLGVFSYSKPKDKFLEELNEQYRYIDNDIYKNISNERQSFISSLEVMGLIEKIDMKKFGEDVLKELNKKETFKKELTLDDLFKYLGGFFDFSGEDLQILDIENIKDEKVKKYLEIIIAFFPHSNYLKNANDELKNLKLSLKYASKTIISKIEKLCI